MPSWMLSWRTSGDLSIEEHQAGDGATHRPQAFPGAVKEALVGQEAWKKSAFADASVMALAASAEGGPSSSDLGTRVSDGGVVEHNLLPRDFIARALKKAPPSAIDQPPAHGGNPPGGSMEAIPVARRLKPSRTFSRRQGVAIQVRIVTCLMKKMSNRT